MPLGFHVKHQFQEPIYEDPIRGEAFHELKSLDYFPREVVGGYKAHSGQQRPHVLPGDRGKSSLKGLVEWPLPSPFREKGLQVFVGEGRKAPKQATGCGSPEGEIIQWIVEETQKGHQSLKEVRAA